MSDTGRQDLYIVEQNVLTAVHHIIKKRKDSLIIGVLALFMSGPQASAKVQKSAPSPYLLGSLGLNTIPSARMDEAGVVRAGISTSDPYTHHYLGFQPIKPLYLSLRQTSEVSSVFGSPTRFYPGLDAKIRVFEETQMRPELSVGLQSAVGHKRMAGEYIAASKRYKNFDFTGGLGWGRYGTAAHFSNPFKSIAPGHFGKKRDLDGQDPNSLEDWFTGESVGFFGGVEYFTPLDALSLKLDYGADRYRAETAASSFDAPAPWSVGVSYAPASWFNAALGVQGTDKVFARLSLQSNVKKWLGTYEGVRGDHSAFKPFRTEGSTSEAIERIGRSSDALLYDTSQTSEGVSTKLALRHIPSTPQQIGEAAIALANGADQDVEVINVVPTILGLRGPAVQFLRRDLEQHYIHNQSSPQEIWSHTTFEEEPARLIEIPSRPVNILSPKLFHFTLETHGSLSEEDRGGFVRTSLITEVKTLRLPGFLDVGAGLRWNLYDNLDSLFDNRVRAFLPVRSDVDRFADRLVSLDTLYGSLSHSVTPNLHVIGAMGFLEEMYGGVGGEVLYRPFSSRLAIGAEAWQALKRNPDVAFNLGFNGDQVLTGHVNAWYDIPAYDATASFRAGRYLSEDIGATLGLSKTFKNGAELKTFINIANDADLDFLGGTSHAYQGIQLTLPLGNTAYLPQNTKIRTKFEPIGRDVGQRINSPVPLYDLTSQISKSHMIQNWNKIVHRP